MQNSLSGLTVSPATLLYQERNLETWFRRFLTFENCALFFPTLYDSMEPQLLPEEKKLFVPLLWESKPVGMLLFSGVALQGARRLLPWLGQIARAALESLALAQRLHTDPQTGLTTESAFFAHFDNRTALHRVTNGDPGMSSECSSMHRICLGLVVLSFFDVQDFIREFDHETCEDLILQAARLLALNLPENAVGARLGQYEGLYELGVLFPAFGRKAGRQLSQNLLEKIDRLTKKDAATGKLARIRMVAGHALYPQDMLGHEFVLPALEQALRLRRRARHAAQCAWLAGGSSRKARVFAFADILRSGGTVTANLGHGKVRVSLGSLANAREGMRFQVYGRDHSREMVNKGQLVLLQTHPDFSLAEMLFQALPGQEPGEGDALELVRTSPAGISGDWEKPADSISGLTLASHREFLHEFEKAAAQASRFSLGIARVEQARGSSGFYGRLEQRAEGEDAPRLPDLAGLYGSNGIIFFYGESNGAEALAFAEMLGQISSECGCKFACGIFNFPFLTTGRQESEECALKALEYAQLLPAPHIGVLDSTALTISADKLFSLGDTLGAIKEYKLAVLADPGNAMALNSLGVCMCALGKNASGRRFFSDALEVAKEPAIRARIYYNIGTVAQKAGDQAQALNAYRQCARNDKRHVFAFLRLGQLLQAQGRKAQARRYLRHAVHVAQDNTALLGLAERQLAMLEAEADQNVASGLLHDVLSRNPDDHAALSMLARLYLESGEDASTAEVLARQSARLGGGREALEILERALAAQGKTEQADVVKKRKANRADR